MVDFQEEFPDDDLRTSGDGKFLDSNDALPHFINYEDLPRCSKTLLDPPPHGIEYFNSQLKAVTNYYRNISNDDIFLDYIMIDHLYTTDNKMEYYAQSENRLAELYIETLTDSATSNKIIDIAVTKNWLNDDFIVVVFHAGLGQDLGSPGFDPTIYDIHSAYIDSDMITSFPIINTDSESDNFGEDRIISDGILLPETLNPIYYDVIEDMYNISLLNEDDLKDAYCFYQTGMTGLFAYLLGYRFCMPPMHSTDDIYPVTRIGRFGLMDYGAYNRHGLMPAPPNAWTRIQHHQLAPQSAINITEEMFNSYPDAFSIDINSGLETVYRLDISDSEYFLIEHRSNLLVDNSMLEDLEHDRYSINAIIGYLDCNPEYSDCPLNIQDILKSNLPDEFNNVTKDYYRYWLDIIKLLYDNDDFEFMDSNGSGVIVNFPDYDHGLPGSGLLIWHITEPSPGLFYEGINNDRYNKAIALEEGDGMYHLGFYDPDPFGSIIPEGWEYDFWYNNNEYYESINKLSESEVANNTFFSEFSIPNSNTASGLGSNIAIQILSDRNEEQMEFSVQFTSDRIEPIINISEIVPYNSGLYSFRYLGNNGDGVIYYEIYNPIDNIAWGYYKKQFSTNETTLLLNNDFNNDVCKPYDLYVDDNDIILYIDETELLCIVDTLSYYINPNQNPFNISNSTINPMGYFTSNNLIGGSYEELNITSDNIEYALGDFDDDGLDEIVSVSNGFLSIHKNNGVTKSGFPLNKDFVGIPLIADIKGDDKPEIICKTSNSILVISDLGDIVEELPLYDLNHPIILIPDIDNNNTYLINGNRSYKFEKYNSSAAFWMNPYSTTYNYPLSGVDGSTRFIHQQNWEVSINQNDYGIDISRTFNYPNPFEDETKFRFFVGSSNNAKIKIYNASGFLVDDFQINSLQNHQYNEYFYNTSTLSPGVYFAEIKSDKNESKLIKLLKTK